MAEHCRRLALESIEEAALLDDPTPDQSFIMIGGAGMNVAQGAFFCDGLPDRNMGRDAAGTLT